MRLVVISDTHGDYLTFEKIIEKHKKDGDYFIFLGDGYKEFEDISSLYNDLKMISVRGNCDFGSLAKETEYLFIDSYKIMITHGQAYSVKVGNAHIISTAQANNVDILLYGHTHKRFTGYFNGLYVLNPGSLRRPAYGKKSYGIVDITKSGVITNIIDIDF